MHAWHRRVLPTHHTGKHAAKAPEVQGVIVQLSGEGGSVSEKGEGTLQELKGVCYLVVYKQLWPFEVARGHPHIILLPRVVELSQAPVNQPQLK